MRVWIRSIVVVVVVAVAVAVAVAVVALQIDKDVTNFYWWKIHLSVVYSVLLEKLENSAIVKFLYNPSRMNLNLMQSASKCSYLVYECNLPNGLWPADFQGLLLFSRPTNALGPLIYFRPKYSYGFSHAVGPNCHRPTNSNKPTNISCPVSGSTDIFFINVGQYLHCVTLQWYKIYIYIPLT